MASPHPHQNRRVTHAIRHSPELTKTTNATQTPIQHDRFFRKKGTRSVPRGMRASLGLLPGESRMRRRGKLPCTLPGNSTLFDSRARLA